MEAYLSKARSRPVALSGIVENGVIRLTDPGVKLAERTRVIVVTTEA
jgi:hypothetical protein